MKAMKAMKTVMKKSKAGAPRCARAVARQTSADSSSNTSLPSSPVAQSAMPATPPHAKAAAKAASPGMSSSPAIAKASPPGMPSSPAAAAATSPGKSSPGAGKDKARKAVAGGSVLALMDTWPGRTQGVPAATEAVAEVEADGTADVVMKRPAKASKSAKQNNVLAVLGTGEEGTDKGKSIWLNKMKNRNALDADYLS